MSKKSKASFSTHFHHQKDGVEYDECHDKVLERRRHHHPPDLVLETVNLFRHVALQRLGLDGEVDARFLARKINTISTYPEHLRYFQSSCLVLIDLAILQFSLALLLKGDDDQSDEDVDEEEWEDDKVDDVEYEHLDAEEGDWTLVLVGHCHGILKNAAGKSSSVPGEAISFEQEMEKWAEWAGTSLCSQPSHFYLSCSKLIASPGITSYH